jgi:DNA (cytosine-5)-methyltransferase 1
MNHIGLFEGIGGFSLAASWMGWETIAWCEWNEFGQKVLKHHFPKAQPHGDITKTDFTIYRGQCDIVTGGFPCQPYSLAGKRKGKEDDRHLWPEMCRAIREIQPTWVLGENVFGLVNWDGGLVFNEVQADLEAEGYEVFPYVLPAVSVNAPHRRDRIWFVAYSSNNGHKNRHTKAGGEVECSKSRRMQQFKGVGRERFTANPNSNGQHGSNSEHEINTSEGGEYALSNTEQMGEHNASDSTSQSSRGELQQRQRQREFGGCDSINYATNTNDKRLERECRAIGKLERGFRPTMPDSSNNKPNTWQNFPTQSPICSGDDGVSSRLDSITFSKWRNESIKAAGNAIVPQVAYQIFKAIKLYNETV